LSEFPPWISLSIVAKYKHPRYRASDQRSRDWIKIKNSKYTQAERRHELFEELRAR
jgi:hypothetical protein